MILKVLNIQNNNDIHLETIIHLYNKITYPKNCLDKRKVHKSI